MNDTYLVGEFVNRDDSASELMAAWINANSHTHTLTTVVASSRYGLSSLVAVMVRRDAA